MKKMIGIICLIVIAVVSLLIGAHDLTVSNLLEIEGRDQLIMLTSRVPRTVSLIIAGATMSVCGLIMQHLTQNKFVSPTTAGTMDSARLGILVSMVFFNQATLFQQTLISFLFAVTGTLVFVTFLNHVRVRNIVMVPLIGMMFGNIVGSAATFLAYQYDLVQNVSSWLQGNFSLVNSGNYELIYVALPLLIILYLFADFFTVAGLGREIATELGVNYRMIQTSGIVIISLATAVVILIAGTLPFLGIIVPNIVSMRKGDHLKKTLFEIALFGSIFLLICDIIARVIIAPYELPVSLIVGIIGSMVFIYLLFKGGDSQ